MRTGWFIETQEPLSSEQRQRARELAAAAGLTVETRHDVRDLPVIRDVATSIGLFLAMGILAMTVGLIRGEAARDLRTLTATGATSAVRRTLTGVTSGALALLGAVLGCAAAYVALGAGYIDDLGRFDRVPTVHLLVIVVGIPLLAASVGWLLAGREPSALGRQPIE